MFVIDILGFLFPDWMLALWLAGAKLACTTISALQQRQTHFCLLPVVRFNRFTLGAYKNAHN